mgnify:CR=1 FL=1
MNTWINKIVGYLNKFLEVGVLLLAVSVIAEILFETQSGGQIRHAVWISEITTKHCARNETTCTVQWVLGCRATFELLW